MMGISGMMTEVEVCVYLAVVSSNYRAVYTHLFY